MSRQIVVNPASVFAIIGLSLFLVGCKERKDEASQNPAVVQDEPAEADRQLQMMSSMASDLKASPDPGKARQQIGELWIQTGHLKREGKNTRNVEGLLSDLEGNLRSNQQDTSARRRLANELEYEIEALKRKNR